jgi:hypothetical protein
MECRYDSRYHVVKMNGRVMMAIGGDAVRFVGSWVCFTGSFPRIHYENYLEQRREARALSGIADRDRELIGNEQTPLIALPKYSSR